MERIPLHSWEMGLSLQYHVTIINQLNDLNLMGYYIIGLAIRQNTIKKLNPTEREIEVAAYLMKKNIIAILYHCVKGNDPAQSAQQHHFCPQGESSWCKWQQDKASGKSTYSDEDCLPSVFKEVLKPTFLALRCVLGATQNQNDSLNDLVWARCPKHKHHGYKAIRCSVACAVCHFHKGADSRLRAMKRLSIDPGTHTQAACVKKDKQRIRKSDKQATDKQEMSFFLHLLQVASLIGHIERECARSIYTTGMYSIHRYV